jgi:hypothetical protein
VRIANQQFCPEFLKNSSRRKHFPSNIQAPDRVIQVAFSGLP